MTTNSSYNLEERLIPDRLIGFRLWKIESLRLRALNNTYQWKSGINCARCSVVKPRPHSSPAIYCSCGFYAKYKYTDLRFEVLKTLSWSHYQDPLGIEVAGAIAATGRVVLGSVGFRAEKAQILGICPVLNIYGPEQIETTKFVACEYGVPWFDTMTSLVSRFPEEESITEEMQQVLVGNYDPLKPNPNMSILYGNTPTTSTPFVIPYNNMYITPTGY